MVAVLKRRPSRPFEGPCLTRVTGSGATFISFAHKDFSHQEPLGHKQPVTCSTHNSLGIVSETHSEILNMGSGVGQIQATRIHRRDSGK